MTTTVLTAKFDFSQPKSATKQTAAQMDQLKNKAKGAQGQLDNTAGSAKGAGAAAAFLGKASKGAAPGVRALGRSHRSLLRSIYEIEKVTRCKATTYIVPRHTRT